MSANQDPGTLRGPVLWPVSPRRLVALEHGVVAPDLPEPRPARPGDPPPEAGLILAGFADWHFHPVQLSIAGAARDGAEPLLPWLRDRAWPAEAALADRGACRESAAAALRALAAAGTLAGAALASPHPQSAAAFLVGSPRSFVCGPAVMTAGEPAELLQPVANVLDALARLHAVFGTRVAVSPRFALSCDDETLRALGEFAAARSLVVQTHLSENEEEVREVRRRFPDAADPLDVYGRAGLVGPRTLLAHAIHVSEAELGRIAAARATVVHCPTSNRALGSGRMPLERLRRAGVRWVLGSDVGAGPDLCLLDAVAEALDQHAGRAPLTAAELLHRATLDAPAALSGDLDGDVPCRARPGAVVVEPPPGLDARSPDADAWAGALVDSWRRDRRLTVLRAVRWNREGRPR